MSGVNGTGAKGTTTNRSLRIASRVLKLASDEWRDANNRRYLSIKPLIRAVSEADKQTTRPVEYFEEERLLGLLSDKWADIWIFATQTGLRDASQEQLR